MAADVPGQYTRGEIVTQGEAWEAALEAVSRQATRLAELVRASAGGVLFAGCGSTFHLAQWAAAFFQRVTGLPCRAAPSSEVVWQTETLIARGASAPLLVALTRSGETTETVLAAQHIAALGGRSLAISCYGESPVAQLADGVVEIAAGRERSFAQTRSFAGMLVAVQAIAAAVAEDRALEADLARLPGLADDVIGRAEEAGRRLGEDDRYKRLTFLGSGMLRGLAAEATIKIKEMSLATAESFHFMEFRHGPMALVDPAHMTVGLISDSMLSQEASVLQDLAELGGRTWAVAESHDGLPDSLETAFMLNSGLGELARSVLYLPLVQWQGYYRALFLALDPDRPRYTHMVIRLRPDGSAEAR